MVFYSTPEAPGSDVTGDTEVPECTSRENRRLRHFLGGESEAPAVSGGVRRSPHYHTIDNSRTVTANYIRDIQN